MALLTLALGVGANAAIFSVVKAVLLDPLPYRDVRRLVAIAETGPAAPDAPTVDYTTATVLRRSSQSFARVSAFRDGPGILMENDAAEMLRGLSVDYDFFDTLGVGMELGRNFARTDQQEGRRLALILSHDLWARRFSANPKVLGRVLRLSGFDVTVIGVLRSKNVKEFYKIAIPAESIARAIAYAIEQPSDVEIDEIVVRPTVQEF